MDCRNSMPASQCKSLPQLGHGRLLDITTGVRSSPTAASIPHICGSDFPTIHYLRTLLRSGTTALRHHHIVFIVAVTSCEAVTVLQIQRLRLRSVAAEIALHHPSSDLPARQIGL